MVLWNKILSGFDNEDETVNFGARTVFENNGSLYETYTIATIGSEEKVKQFIFYLIQNNLKCQ